MEAQYFPYSGLINAATSFLLGVFVLFKNPKSVTNRRFSFFAFSVGFWSINWAFWMLSQSAGQALFFIRTAMVGAIFIPVIFVSFVMRLLREENRTLNAVNFAIAGIFVCFAFSPVYIQSVEPKLYYRFWPVPGPLFNFMLAYFISNTVYAHVKLWNGIRTSTGPKRIQIKYVFLGTLIGYSGGCTNFPLWYNIPVPPVLNILVSVYILCVAYAIIRHRLMGIDVIVKKTLVFAGLFAAAYGVFASFAYLSAAIFENIVDSKWIAMVPSILIVVGMVRPLESALIHVTDRHLFQKKYDYKQLLKTFANEVVTILDLGELVGSTVNKLNEMLKLEGAAIYLRDERMGRLGLEAKAGEWEPAVEIDGKGTVVATRLNSGEYALRERTGRAGPESAPLDDEMGELGGVLIIPIMCQEELVGALSLGKKKSDEDFSQDDIDILLPLAGTLAIAINNARLFEKLSEAQAQAAQREKMAVIGTLSAGINHEICNPLGISRGQCEMFLLNMTEGVYRDKTSDELLEKAQDIMKKVINETDRATVITRKLSTFAKPAKGEVSEDVRVEDEIDQVISLVEHDLRLDNIVITKEVDKGVPVVAADRKQLQEVFFNIIRNAAQAIKGSGEIWVRVSKARGGVSVDIRDTGEGMDKGRLKQIFNPFFTTKDPGKGTGLGLFIVKQIVERNGGNISVDSEPGKGTTFRILLRSGEVPAKQAGART